MTKRILDFKHLDNFKEKMICEEKSQATIEKYLRDIRTFMLFINENPVTKEKVIAYKNKLREDGYAIRSVNSMLAGINSYFSFLGWNELRVRTIKMQRKIYCSENKELSKTEYERLVNTAKRNNNERLAMLLQTICGMGIRVSELKYVTVETVKKGEAEVICKGKVRSVFIMRKLQLKLSEYAKKHGIQSGSIFVTKNGNPMSRTNIWREMKSLCVMANVDPEKVFPHNLRHLFARVFYSIEKDIVKLADVLGHSSIDTTRIYIISTGTEHRRCIESMRLII
ncbi:MAG: tyrosine-type recombinase/integrase [Lachnospiraceae bacterium]|nr:tyrosine-type recombinase/integrase [Lachnospiraceae bacterium]